MTRFWTSHWQNRFWRDEINSEYEPLNHAAGNSFRKRGVSIGDVIYVISLAGGRLFLGGSLTVQRIVSRDEAVRTFGTEDLWDAVEHIIGQEQSGTPLNLHRVLAPEVSRQLRFVSPQSEPKSLFFDSKTKLNVQSTRGVRELTADSAALLDRIITVTDRVPRSSQLIAVTEKLLRGEPVAEPAQQLREDETVEIDDAGLIREGAKYQVILNAYERDPAARRLCIAKYGTNCSICGFSFGARYGKAADGIIHVHHLRPLSDVGEEYEVDPVVDLRPVCPNCHAVLHRRQPPYSLDEVRQFLKARREHSAAGPQPKQKLNHR